jgi:hypothetical protein
MNFEHSLAFRLYKIRVFCCSNPVVPCSLIPAPSLEPWREQKQAAQSVVQPQQEDYAFSFPFFKK